MIATIMLIFSIVLLLAILGHAAIGLLKGWKRCLLGLCRTFSALILAFLTVFVFCWITPSEEMFGGLLAPAFESNSVLSGVPSVSTLGGNITGSFVMPFIFTVLFGIYDLLLLIPALFIGRALGIYKTKKKKEAEKKEQTAEETDDNVEAVESESSTAPDQSTDIITTDEETPAEEHENSEAPKKENKDEKKKLTWGERFGGAGISLVTATLVILLYLLPLSGILYTFTDGIDHITQTADDLDLHTVPLAGLVDPNTVSGINGYAIFDRGNLNVDNAQKLIEEYIAPIRDNIFLRMSYSAPMRLIYNGMLGPHSSNISTGNEISQVFDLFSNALYLSVDLEDYGEDQKTAVNNITGYISKSDLHCQITAELLSSFSKEILNDTTGNYSDLTEGTTSIVAKPLLTFFSNEGDRSFGKENVKDTLNTISNVLCIMIDYDLPYHLAEALAEESHDGLALDMFSNENMLADMMLELYHNEDFREEMLSPMVDLMFTILVKSFDVNAEPVHVAEHTDLTDAQVKDEAKLLAKIIGELDLVIETLPDIVESNDAVSAIATTNMGIIGRCIDDAEKSILIGEGVDIIFVTILNAPSFDSMRGVADILIRHIQSGEDLEMESLMLAVQDFAGILNNYENGNGDTMGLSDTLRSLSKNLTGSTKDIMLEIINDSGALNIGMISTGENKTTQKLLSVVIEQLADSDMTDEEYEKEAKAIDYALQLVNVSTSSNSEEGSSSESIKNIYNDEEGMSEMIETLSSSKITSSAINVFAYETDENGDYILDENGDKVKTEEAQNITENMDAEDQEKLFDEIEKHYKSEATQKTEEEMEIMRENLTSLSTVFGIDISDAMVQWDIDLNN